MSIDPAIAPPLPPKDTKKEEQGGDLEQNENKRDSASPSSVPSAPTELTCPTDTTNTETLDGQVPQINTPEDSQALAKSMQRDQKSLSLSMPPQRQPPGKPKPKPKPTDPDTSFQLPPPPQAHSKRGKRTTIMFSPGSLQNLADMTEEAGRGEQLGGAGVKRATTQGELPAVEVDKLQAVQKPKGRRAAVEAELLATEESYVKSLSTLINCFMTPLLETQEAADLQNIFSNIQAIVSVNRTLLEQLRQEGVSVGNVFVRLAPFFRVYIAFINNYENAVCTLEKKKTDEPSFASTIAVLEKQSGSTLNLESYLIMPVQRIPRYVMLFNELLKHTPKSDPQHPELANALENVKAIATEINEAKRKSENLAKILSIQKHLANSPLKLVEPHRRWIRDGYISRVINGKLEDAYMFLFNDIIVFARTFQQSTSQSHLSLLFSDQQTFTYQGVIKLDHVFVSPAVPDELAIGGLVLECAFTVGAPPNHQMVLCARSEDEQASWMLDITTQIAQISQMSRFSTAWDSGSEIMIPSKKEGFLQKKGEVVPTWKKRFFALKGALLFYFVQPMDFEPKGSIDLHRVSLEVDDPPSTGFRLVSSKRTYFLQADTEDEKEEWAENLRACINMLKHYNI